MSCVQMVVANERSLEYYMREVPGDHEKEL